MRRERKVWRKKTKVIKEREGRMSSRGRISVGREKDGRKRKNCLEKGKRSRRREDE